MDKSVQYFADQMLGIRWGIVTAGLLDTVRVPKDGQLVPVKHLAHTRPDQGRILVTPFDLTTMGMVEKALKQAGFNAYTFSKTAIVVGVPKPNSEEKERVVGHVKRLTEEAKVAIRNVRKKARQKLDRDDDKELQKLTDNYIAEVDRLAQNKIDSMR